MNRALGWAVGAALLAIVVAPAPGRSAPPSRALLATRWQSASRAAIAKVHAPARRAAAQRQFDATLARMRAPARAVAPAADLRAAAVRELRGGYDLRDASKPPPETPWQRFWDWVGAQWNKLMNLLFGRVHLDGKSSVVVGDVLLALAAAGICFALFRFAVSMQVDKARSTTAFAPLEHRKNAHALYLQACALARDGAFEAAVQKLFLAAITALDLRGVLRENPSATVGDMRRALRARDAQLLPPFDEVCAPFVAATYAQTPVAPAEWTEAAQAYARLIAAEAAT